MRNIGIPRRPPIRRPVLLPYPNYRDAAMLVLACLLPFVLAAAVLLLAMCGAPAATNPTGSIATPESAHCRLLRDMHRTWVELDTAQERGRRELVFWYFKLCQKDGIS